MSAFEARPRKKMSQRQQVRLLLSNLLEAKLAQKLASSEHAANAAAVAARLQAEARVLVARVGNAKDRARLAALLSIRWLWLMVLDLPF